MTESNMLNGLPVFPITWWRRNEDFPNCLLVTFKCPCGRTHCHGWPKDADPFTPQHRLAHCFDGPLREKGYYIVLQQRELSAVSAVEGSNESIADVGGGGVFKVLPPILARFRYQREQPQLQAHLLTHSGRGRSGGSDRPRFGIRDW